MWRSPGGGWAVTSAKELVCLNPSLRPVATYALPYDWPGMHGLAADGQLAALSLADRVALVDPHGGTIWEAPHRHWADGSSGSTWIADGVVWATVPGADGVPDRWWVLDAATGHLLADLSLECRAVGSDPIPTESAVLLGLSVGSRSQGFHIYCGRRGAEGATVQRMPGTTRVLSDVHPSGEVYLTTAQDHEDVAVHAISDGGVVARRAASDLLDGTDLIDFKAAYVTDEVVVVRTVLEEAHLALDAATLEYLAVVDYPVGSGRDNVLGAGYGSWLTTDWLDGHLQLWSL